MHKKHLVVDWIDIDARPIRTRCGLYIDNLDDMITNDTDVAYHCKRCVHAVEASARRRRRLGLVK